MEPSRTPAPTTSRSWTGARVAAWLALAWLLVGALDLAFNSSLVVLRGYRVIWGPSLAFAFAFWGLQAVLAPGLVLLLGRLPFERGRWLRSAVPCLLALPAFVLLHHELRRAWLNLAAAWVGPALAAYTADDPQSRALSLYGSAWVFVTTAAAVNGERLYRRYRERERAAAALELDRARLRAELSEARLAALQAQLQPHFLFNSLHALSTLILRGEARAADEMLGHISRFLRMTLDDGEAPTIPLEEELGFLEAYLAILRARFGDRLRVECDIDPRARALRVPRLVLQPLVENSVRHGDSVEAGPCRIGVRARLEDGALALEVEDDGHGPPPAPAAEGIGIGNIRRRLEQLYPGAHALTLGPGPAGGALTRLVIPVLARSGDAHDDGR